MDAVVVLSVCCQEARNSRAVEILERFQVGSGLLGKRTVCEDERGLEQNQNHHFP